MSVLLDDNGFRKLLNHFERPWSGYRKVRKGVMKRIRRHMRDVGVIDVEKYIELLSADTGEEAICKSCLQVTISRFFRDRRLWQHLKTRILPDLVIGFPAGIRVWSVGCGCGEEVYSFAILWREMQKYVSLTILATDINTENLQRAKTGIYGVSSLKEVAAEIREKYFTHDKDRKSFTIIDEVKRDISWLEHDLFTEPPAGKYHIIFLRNSLLMYHRGVEQAKAFDMIVQRLEPGGILIIGSHEKIVEGKREYFKREEKCPWLFRLKEQSVFT